MTRLWMAPVIAIALVGCRSSQPTANPFLRTTVAPPATTVPAVVMPGEPFSPGVVAPPGVQTVPAPVVPVAPVAPPVVAPPYVAPPRDKYSPPGGSFQYNQSSLDRRAVPTQASPVTLAAYREPVAAARPIQPVEARPIAPPPATRAFAGTPGNQIRIPPPSPIAGNEADDDALPDEESDVAAAGEQVDDDSTGALLASNDSDDADDEQETIEDRRPQKSNPDPGRTVRNSDTGYGYAPDYAWLRGRLEYSETARQWKLRYIPIDGKTDRFGGSVKLPSANALASFKSGDMVSVRGALAQQAAAGDPLAPLYNLAQIQAATP
jgi:hypothetical protein